jgi:hypothetical protein
MKKLWKLRHILRRRLKIWNRGGNRRGRKEKKRNRRKEREDKIWRNSLELNREIGN